ncbi:RNA-dependent RNA polymerase [Erysiphe necator associated ourmia-like virus 79]|nr:RNA-dependent RNA polymerase [Erysiphe necator associated ourmia-like virus 79]
MTSDKQPATRQCRDYQARTMRIVNAAIKSWERIFEKDPIPLQLDNTRYCSDYAKKVKAILSSCPSNDQSEVLAWQSIKKLLPDSCRCQERNMLSDLHHKLSSPARPLPRGYLQFARREVLRIFRTGWDRGSYEDHVLTTSPPLSSTTEHSRSEGGCLGSDFDYSDFIETCLLGPDFNLDRAAKMIVVQSAGKPRALTKFSPDTLCLRPLHKAVYDRISRESWLNRGDVTTDKLRDAGFRRVDGEFLTSGDYKSATDNLSLEVAEEILKAILSTAVSVPQSVKNAAMDILRPNLFSLENGIDFTPTVGQMMGSYLSFPLLCLQNRIAFLWAGGRGMPCLINGDDILFRSSPEFSRHWMDKVSSLGLEVEETKTSVSESYGTLNSTLIVRKHGRYVVRQTLRFGMLRECEDVTSLCDTFSDFLSGVHGTVRYRAGVEFFKWHLGTIKNQRLTTLELGFRGDLAWRITRKFDLPMHPLTYDLPYLGPDHNVVVPRDKCTFVEPGTLTREDRKKSAREMAAWKFSCEFKSLAKRSRLDFFLKLSQIRPTAPNFLPYLSGFGEGSGISRPTWAATRRWYVTPKPIRKDTFPLMIEPEEQLPPYEAFEAGECLIEVGKFCSKE